MRAAFFHDSILKWDCKNDKYYTSGGLTYPYLTRYLKYFDTLTMVTRKEQIKKYEDVDKLSITSGNGIAFHCVSGLSIGGLYGSIRKTIRRVLNENDFAIIRLPSMIGIVACRECNKLGKPYIVEMVGSPFCALWYYGKTIYKIMAPFYATMNKHLIKKAENVIYVTNDYLQHGYPNHHNNIGISDVNIQEIDSRVLEKRKKRIMAYSDRTVYRIGLIGSMDVKYKGHDIAIKSIPVLKRDGINVEMHFLGKCSNISKDRLMRLANRCHVSNRVFIDGVLSGGHEVLKWIDDKDMIVLPSKQEGLPRSLVEAMSRAAVCVGARTGGIPELLLDDCIMNKRNEVGLAEVISRLVNDKKEMVKIARLNYEKSKDYSYVILAKRMNCYYEKTLYKGGDRR